MTKGKTRKVMCSVCTGYIESSPEPPLTKREAHYRWALDFDERTADFLGQGCPHYGDGCTDVEQFENMGGNLVAPIKIPAGYKKQPIEELLGTLELE